MRWERAKYRNKKNNERGKKVKSFQKARTVQLKINLYVQKLMSFAIDLLRQLRQIFKPERKVKLMSVKIKGSDAERELLHMFWSRKWACIRSAGSGSMKYPGPDLIAGNKIRRLAIECKSTKDTKRYLDRHDVEQLKEFCEIFGAEAWFAIRFARANWLFLSLEDIEKTEKGYVIDAKVAERRGLLIDELIK